MKKIMKKKIKKIKLHILILIIKKKIKKIKNLIIIKKIKVIYKI